MHLIRLVVCWAILCYISVPALGAGSQSFVFDFEVIDNTKGLPVNEIRRIHQDREGFLWFASTNGVIRYDGYEFLTYKSQLTTPDLLPSNNILTMCDDSLSIWIGTDNGLCRIDKGTRHIVRVEHPRLHNVTVNKVLADNGHVWLASNSGVYRYTPATDSVVHYAGAPHSGKVPGNDTKDIFKDSKGRLWLAVNKGGLSRYNAKRDTFEPYPKFNSDNSAHVIYEDIDGHIWVGSWGHGVTMLENEESPHSVRYTTLLIQPGNATYSNIIYSIAQDSSSGYLWIGHRNGLSLLKPPFKEGQFVNYRFDGSAVSISNNDVSAVIRDRTGIMWLGTMGGGVNKINLTPSKLEYNPLKQVAERFNNTFITSTYLDPRGRLWLGVKNKGLVIYDPTSGEYRHSSQIPALAIMPEKAQIQAITPVMGGRQVWVGTSDNGMYKVEIDNSGAPVGCRYVGVGEGSPLGSYNVTRIFNDSHRNIWIATGGGITLLDAQGYLRFKSNFLEDKAERLPINSITEHRSGEVWLGVGHRGLIRIKLDGTSVNHKFYTRENGGINSNALLSVYADAAGNIWAGTKGGGLSLYNRSLDRFVSANEYFNIPFDDIFNIFEDTDHNIFMCSHNALIRLNVSRNRKAEIYTSSDGLRDNVFNITCLALKLDSTRFLLGGMRGYNILRSDLIGVSQYCPPLIITDIEVEYRSIFEQNGDKGYRYDNKLTLSSSSNSFTTQFVALSYANPGRNHYAYRLKGYEKKWHYVNSDQRRASYTNLSKGDYVFEVIASNENGVWTETPTELSVTVLPSPFDTWYAHLIYIALICTALGVTYRVVSNRVKLKHQLHIAEIENVKQEELNQSKLHFFTNISHELLTPLTIISCASEELKAALESDKYHISVIESNVNRLVRLIRQVLEFRKAENYKLKLKVSQGDIAKMVRNICDDNFRPLAKQKSIDFKFTSSADCIIGWFDTDKVDKILYNLLSNAFKYNYDNSYVVVTLEQHGTTPNRSAVITIKDGGIGIEPQNLTRIFERFYDGDYRRANTQGTGIGMPLTKSLVELHKGSIEVESIPGAGSQFRVTIPLDAEAYDEKEIERDDVTDVEQLAQDSDTVHDKNILIVEDNAELQCLVSSALSGNYNVKCASNGCEAIEQLEQEAFDLVISDIMMPKMSGTELCEHIKSNIEFSHIPVILLTAKSSEEDKISGYDSGADAFITKPFKMQLLRSRITNLLRGREKLMRNFQKGDDSVQLKSITYTTIDEKLLQRAVEIVEANISNEDFNFDLFVSEMGVSKSMLYRKIKLLTGMTTSDFIKDIRLKAACRIMREKPVGVAEVAYAVGFGQPKYFGVCFKKKFGMLPSEYISRQHQTVREVVDEENE